MNKIFSVLILLFVSAFMSAVAAVPTWTVNPNDYNYSMTVTAVINLDGVESVDTNDILAAFVDGQCRGVVKPLYNASTGRYIAYLIVYSNSVSETVVLKVYDASADAERTITQPITFVVDGALGKTVSPLIVSDPTLSNEAEITGFSISGQTGSTIFDTNSISLLMPHGTDLSALIPTFVTSPLATVTVGGIVQQSGVSVNDMSSPVEYTVRSADETTTQTYSLSVAIANAIPTDIYLSSSNVNETVGTGTLIGALNSEDGNASDIHTYTLVPGTGDTDNASFLIDGGGLKANISFDYETKTFYNVRIKTDDGKGGSFEKAFTVNVIDENDEKPVVTSQNLTLSESDPPGIVTTIIAADADVTPGFKTLVYSISAGNEAGKFSINPGDGVVSLVSTLDFEVTTSYLLEISVSDGSNTATGTVTISVSDTNDSFPVLNETVHSILETNLPGQLVTTVSATDADANTNLSFSISNGNTGTMFGINADNGQLVIAGNPDYESVTSYNLEVTVFDGVNSSSGIIVVNLVDVNDEKPDVVNASLSIDETIAVGSVVHNIVANDGDAGAVLQYTIVSGNSNQQFGIDINTGELKVLLALDYEVMKTYFIEVAVSDGVNTGNGVVTLNLNDLNDEVPTLAGANLSVSESTMVGSMIHAAIANDNDANTTFTYSIESGNEAGIFFINVSTGVITLLSALDFETTSSYNLEISVNDGVRSESAIVEITVEDENDELPIAYDAMVFVDEDVIPGYLIYTVEAEDPDAGTSFEFSISAGNEAGLFQIDEQRGKIISQLGLDYESSQILTLTILVTDGLHETTATITININDVNDEIPNVVSASLSIDETIAVGSVVHNIVANDGDAGSVLEYTIVSGNSNQQFGINANTGVLRVLSALDFELIQTYVLEVAVSDGIYTGTGAITLHLNDLNDEIPSLGSPTLSVLESTDIGFPIYIAVGEDRDANTAFTYAIESGNEQGTWGIESSTGTIWLANTLDFEATTSYELEISVNDGIRSAPALVNISVEDVNDEIPIAFDANVFVAEDVVAGYPVHSMEVTDADAGTSFEFSITSGNEAVLFQINERKGTIVTQRELDYETLQSVTLEILISDGVHETTASIVVNINNVNDIPPVITQATVEIGEDYELGTLVHAIQAEDADEGPQLFFTLSAGNEADIFSIEASTGIIYLRGGLDFETKTVYVLDVQVSDGVFTSNTSITVNILDINDEFPVLENSVLSVPEFASQGDFIGQITASDADAGSELSFSQSSNLSGDMFTVDAAGNVYLVGLLDYEKVDSYEFEVVVSDGVNEVIGMVIVEVENMNEAQFDANNAFSPNGDGINDVWEILDVEKYRNCEIYIYDHLSNLVFQSHGYETPWEGTYNGKPLPLGTYYYIVKCPECWECTHSGSISLLY